MDFSSPELQRKTLDDQPELLLNGAANPSGIADVPDVSTYALSSVTFAQEEAISQHNDDSNLIRGEAESGMGASTDDKSWPKGTKDIPISENNAEAVELDSPDKIGEENADTEALGLDEHDSLVTVRLSELPILSVNTGSRSSRESADSYFEDIRPATPTRSQRGTMPTVVEDEADSNDVSDEGEEVNWEQLQQTEHEESNGQTTDNASPRGVRPLSVAQLRHMIEGPTPSALRYSMLPAPPMTDLEFYAALVQDYHQTAARLPTLLSNKIRKGIPPPLRGVVWQGMSGATRDVALCDQYDRFCDASSPYEGIIGKDLGRSFPGVEMFREPDGDGQRMLGTVLKSYSLHEPSIGYCQGLAFLVGPLLMHMPDKEAFCVLVKLMENYDLRSSYMPDLAGLHVRIYQFRELLRSTLPELSSHLELLQVDPAAYVAQWFLSIFAVTCPLPMLFRMYDVAFAEGAAETIMRVALSLMQKNQARLLACAELEDAMQLLLSRGLWDCYHYNADEFVLHFLSLSNVVTRDRLASLDQGYRKAQIASINPIDPDGTADRSSAISAIASRFLGRLWTPSSSSVPTASSIAAAQTPLAIHELPSPPHLTSSPKNQPLGFNAGHGTSPLRPLSLLQRSSSKNSIASTVNSVEATSSTAGTSSATSSSSSSVLSSTSTDATSVSRDSASEAKVGAKIIAAPSSSVPHKKSAENDRYLHSQIEDLLTAFSDLQRQHALLADQLQREREERSDDKKVVQALLQGLRQESTRKVATVTSEIAPDADDAQIRATDADDSASTSESVAGLSCDNEMFIPGIKLQVLTKPVEDRFASVDNRRSSVPQTKLQLRDELARAKEQLANEVAKGQDRNRQVCEMEQEVATMKDQLRECHAHARVLHKDNQRLERQICELRTHVVSDAASVSVQTSTGTAHVGNIGAAPTNSSTAISAGTSAQSLADAATEWFGRATGVSVGTSKKPASGGLRELKLVRSNSTPLETSTPTATSNPPQAMNNSYTSGGYGKRSSSLFFRGSDRRESDLGALASSSAPNETMEQEQDLLVLELVQAKTSEAVARQEAEEAKQRLENLRKALGLSSIDMNSMLSNTNTTGVASTGSFAATNMQWRLPTSTSDGGNPAAIKTTADTTSADYDCGVDTSAGYLS
ncbi:hypothetical protein SEPCBS119000_006142 [Sporothrix epigloea]|uniref:Rab-GAP TBC domain-containing protein n=1 Tax=Sporothrix epigloea TaxID=1892477 RepID=A0ABP0E1R2_9PEZI